MNEEEDIKGSSEINPDALEAVFAEEVIIEEDEEDLLVVRSTYDEDDDELDIAFQDDDGDW